MRTYPLRSLIAGICALTGQNPANISTDKLAALMAVINLRTAEAWEYEFWPEWTVTEQRAYRDAWVSGTTYVAGAQVFNAADSSYYQANSAPNTPVAGDQPSLTSTTWTVLSVFERSIPLDQTGQTPIGEVLMINQQDPRVNIRFPGPLAFTVNAEGILVAPLAGAQVWVTFRLRPPVFGATVWNPTPANAVGDIVYRPSTTGECYICTAAVAANQGTNYPEATTANWAQVQFPNRLARFVARGAYADWLRSSGQQDKAAAEEQAAYNHLSQASDVALASQGQFDRATAAVSC